MSKPTEPLPERKDSNPGSVHPRAARQKLAHAQEYLTFLEFACRAKQRLHEDTSALDRELETARNMVANLSRKADARIDPRRRLPRPVLEDQRGPRPEYVLFLDECGSHVLDAASDAFPVFCLFGIIVKSTDYPAFNESWRDWKEQWLGAQDASVHEPGVRTRSGLFYDPDVERSQDRISALDAQLGALPFISIAAAIDKRRFAAEFLDGHVDDFLPRSMYLVCVDFILERFTHFLCHVGKGAQGSVHAESRGLREDAEVHFEYIRLRLDGTQFCPPSQFRGYLRPAMQFERKDGNSSGLQIADLMARPIAEKILNPPATPERWGVVSSKFYDGTKGRRGSYGLKVFPALSDDLFAEYSEKATEDANASPATD